jgi:site-specific DNA-cytosine methylase
MADLVEGIQPEAIMMENVPGIVERGRSIFASPLTGLRVDRL